MSRTGIAIALAVVLVVAGRVPARALEAAQAEAVDRLVASTASKKTAVAAMAAHYAVLLWVEDYCDGRSDESVRAYIMSKTVADPDAFEAGWAEASELLNKAERAAMCELALAQYGPEGALIKGAWSPRR